MNNRRIALLPIAVLAVVGCTPEEPQVEVSTPVAVSPSVVTTASETQTAAPVSPSAAAASESDASAEESVSPEPSAPAIELSNGWETSTISIKTPADAAQLGAGFEGVAEMVDALVSDGECPLEEFTVDRIHPDGYLLGNVMSKCGSGPGLFAESDGVWMQVVGFDGVVMCDDLAAVGAPRGLNYPCSTQADGSGEIDY
ncbi:MAG TPA: hypothetical protein K8V15_06230 [Tessaracoccus flavescens]|uniref:Uncharacterized protein n=1 Tax=Tessaracoccus flavescens TaxID=399497 RepID=A0A921JQQ1_9ACTN|nr:hypothetical protein [Tessaracoccus flavescens]